MTINKQELIQALNDGGPTFIKLMGGKLVDLDLEKIWTCFEFNIGTDYCHSGDIVQGGFVTAMLDVAMSHAVFACNEGVIGLSSLEIKTSYLETTRAGKLRVEGWMIKNGYKTVFLEGRVYNAEGKLSATASTVAKLKRLPAADK